MNETVQNLFYHEFIDTEEGFLTCEIFPAIDGVVANEMHPGSRQANIYDVLYVISALGEDYGEVIKVKEGLYRWSEKDGYYIRYRGKAAAR
jgi:hypothetical protein